MTMKGEEPASVREKHIRGSAAYVIVLRVGVLTNSTADLRHSLHTNNTLDRQIGHVCGALAVRRCPTKYMVRDALLSCRARDVLALRSERVLDEVIGPPLRQVVLWNICQVRSLTDDEN